jgi:methylated-DNA-[protein]-cysteine S-methyltransferase
MSKYKTAKGPSIKAIFHVDESGITEIELSLGKKGLEWEMVGDAPSLLEEKIDKWIDSYIKKRPPEGSLPIVLSDLPPYTTHVLSILRDVPFGISLSYKKLGEITGNPQGARAVGNACARNPFPLVIPCHRVLAAGSSLGGFSCGLGIKEVLLAYEGIFYKNGSCRFL